MGGRQRTFPGLQTQGGKVERKQRLQRTSPLLHKNMLINLPFRPNHGAWTHQLPAHAAAASGSSMGKLQHQSTHTAWRAAGQPPSFTLSQPVPKQGLPSKVEQHPHYSRATHSHAGAQIASLNVIALSQFHEFNIVPGLLFA